jgi:hypothetical protein
MMYKKKEFNMKSKSINKIFVVFLGVVSLLLMVSCGMMSEISEMSIENPCTKWEIDTTKIYVSERSIYKLEIPSGNLVVKNDIGSIYIGRSSDETLYIKNERFGVSEEMLESIRLSADSDGETTEIIVHFWSSGDSLIGFDQLEVYVPEHLTNLTINSQSANIQIDALDANLQIENTCGNLYLEQRSGDAEIDASYGQVYLTSLNGSVDINTNTANVVCSPRIQSDEEYIIQTGSGSISFLPENQMGEIYIATITGSIDLGGRVDLDPDSELNKQKYEFTCEGVSTGDIYGSRGVSMDPGRNLSANPQEIVGKLGAGDAKIHLESMAGNIVIR